MEEETKDGECSKSANDFHEDTARALYVSGVSAQTAEHNDELLALHVQLHNMDETIILANHERDKVKTRMWELTTKPMLETYIGKCFMCPKFDKDNRNLRRFFEQYLKIISIDSETGFLCETFTHYTAHREMIMIKNHLDLPVIISEFPFEISQDEYTIKRGEFLEREKNGDF